MKNISNLEKKEILAQHNLIRESLLKKYNQKVIKEQVELKGVELLNAAKVNPKCRMAYGGKLYSNPKGDNVLFKIADYDSKNNYFKTGDSLYIKDDYTFDVIRDNKKLNTQVLRWSCSALTEKQKEVQRPTNKELNQAQKDALESLKIQGFKVIEPAPSDFKIDNGQFEKLDLTNQNKGQSDVVTQTAGKYTNLITKFGKYFDVKDFPEGFFVYKEVKKEETAPGAQRVEITAESCKTAIESLYNNMKSPNTYPLGNEQIVSLIQTARKCSEPANKKLFVMRFGLKNKLEDISKRYSL